MNKMVFDIRCLACLSALCVPATAGTIYVDGGATGQNNGTAWIDAYTSIAVGISNASAGDEVWVAEGTYTPIVLKSGVKVFGGFAGTESSVSAGDPAVHKTYISGGGVSRPVESIGNDSSTVLRGFHVVNGFVDVPQVGAGLFLKDSDAMFVRCVFTGNRAVALGGAVAIKSGSPTFVNCKFYANDGGWGAGAVFSRRSATTTFINCLFYQNTALEGGAVAILTGSVSFINCTISDNASTIGKGGALFDTLGEAVLWNCILWNNTSPIAGAEEFYNKPSGHGTTAARHCNVQGSWPGAGNIDSDPMFVDAANGDYRLQADSPCRGAGHNASLQADVADLNGNGNRTETLPRDLAMRSRIEGANVDMGAFEFAP